MPFFRLFLLLAVLAASPLRAQIAECGFGFDIDRQSSAFQALTVDGEVKRGLWLSIARAPGDVREVARYVGRLQVCLTTPDGQPREVRRGGGSVTLDSPFVANCTAALMTENRLLTNAHCYADPDLVAAGFTIVREARVNFGYTSKDDTGAVRTFRVSPDPLRRDPDLDALVLQVVEADANAVMGGHFPMRMMTEVEPFQELRMIHHPGADPQQYSTGTCQVHRRQSEIPGDRSPFRHTCESTGGSSGSLLLDARTLAVVALHNQGGLTPTGESFNGGHKIGAIEAALDLGFAPVSDAPVRDAEGEAQSALVAALLLPSDTAKRGALADVSASHPGTIAAGLARDALAAMGPEAPEPPKPQPPVVTQRPEPADPPEPTLREQMLADPAVQACDRLAGAPNHPDRKTGAMAATGRPYSSIDGVAAENVCRRALDHFPGHPRLASFLGDALFTQKKYDEGIRYFRLAAEAGDPTGQTSLGIAHYYGWGVSRDIAEARRWLTKATDQDYAGGFVGLGLIFEEGRAGPADYSKAAEQFRKGADLGDPVAASLLARSYEHGRGVPTDPQRAGDLYVTALQGGIEWMYQTKRVWTGPTARAVQQRLSQLGYYDGAIDGAIGPGTKAAMKALRDASLPPL